MYGARRASAGIILVASLMAAFSRAGSAHPSPQGSEVNQAPTRYDEARQRERYRQSIRSATDASVLFDLALSFEMAGYHDLAAEARKRAAFLTEHGGAEPSAGPPASTEPQQVSGSRVLLLPDTGYRARLSLGFFQCLGSRRKITEKFSQLGFAEVHVYMGEDELPPDWPSSFRPSRGRCARYVEGTWTGAAKVLERPKAVDALWLREVPSEGFAN
jgi:hypothetical protein